MMERPSNSEVFVKMVYHYVETARGHTLQCVYEDFETGWNRAEAFVGEHNEVDGCSTPRRVGVSGNEHWTSRGTSFGLRRASVNALPLMAKG